MMGKTPRVVLNVDKKQKHATYMKERRKVWTEEEINRNKEMSKLRMRKLREKRKQDSSKLILQSDARQTRLAEKQEQEGKRENAEYKKKYRAQLSSQKKRRIREKDAAKKREKRLEIKEKKNRKEKQVPAGYSENSEMSPCSKPTPALKKMLYRVRKKLPKSPRRYAAVVKGLVTCTTPKRKAAMKEQGVHSPNAKKNLTDILEVVKDVHKKLQGKTNKQRSRRREFVRHFSERLNEKSKLQNMFCAVTGIKRKYMNGCSSEKPIKRRKDAVSAELQDSVQKFYESEEVAIVVPDKKAVKKDLEQTQVMQMSLNTAWSKWSNENQEKQLSFDKFCKLRPKKVKTQKHRRLYQCLCEYCENVKLKLTCMNRLAEKVERPDLKLKNEFEAVSASLCPKQGETFHKLNCIDRNCEECGSSHLKERLRPLFDIDDPVQVKWRKWENVKTVNPKTRKEINKRQEVEKSGSPAHLVDELLSELKFLSVHLFEAQWQQKQFASLNNNIPEKSISVTIDFAENYSCFYQNEIQGAHWSKDSVTIHPCICLYRCPNDNQLVDECVDIISDDLIHDTHAVHVFMDHVLHHLKETRQVEFQHAYVISDGCASQYKSRVTFMDVSCSMVDHQITTERSYYGSRHGKNRCDGEGGVLKSKATRDVKNRIANIYNARTFYETVKSLEKPAASEQGTCLHKRRTLLFIGSDEIRHERPERDSKTVSGTRKIHSAMGVERGVIKTRRLSCFCLSCLQKQYDNCLNTQYVDKWKLVKMKPLLLDVQPEELLVAALDQPAVQYPDVPDGQPAEQPDEEQPAVALDQHAVHIPGPTDGTQLSKDGSDDDLSTEDMNVSFTDFGLEPGDISLTSILEILDSEPKYKEGDFVLVKIRSGNKSAEYVAEVKRLLPNDEVVLQYMEKSEGFYRWPVRDDISQEHISSIVQLLQSPVLVEEKSSTRIQIYEVKL